MHKYEGKPATLKHQDNQSMEIELVDETNQAMCQATQIQQSDCTNVLKLDEDLVLCTEQLKLEIPDDPTLTLHDDKCNDGSVDYSLREADITAFTVAEHDTRNVETTSHVEAVSGRLDQSLEISSSNVSVPIIVELDAKDERSVEMGSVTCIKRFEPIEDHSKSNDVSNIPLSDISSKRHCKFSSVCSREFIQDEDEDNQFSLESCLKDFSSPEVLKGSERFCCQVCTERARNFEGETLREPKDEPSECTPKQVDMNEKYQHSLEKTSETLHTVCWRESTYTKSSSSSSGCEQDEGNDTESTKESDGKSNVHVL